MKISDRMNLALSSESSGQHAAELLPAIPEARLISAAAVNAAPHPIM